MDYAVYTQRVEIVESYGERRDCADQRIPAFLRDCGYLPVPLPNDGLLAERMVLTLKPSGIVLTGGNSLVKYGGDAPERDGTDAALIRIAVEKGIPLYGFCRGMQSVLDFFGCRLENVGGHRAVRHMVSGKAGIFEVNSYHNQACLELGEDCPLDAVGRAEDGAVEEVRHRTLPIAAVMWHPERESPWKESDMERVRNIFRRV